MGDREGAWMGRMEDGGWRMDQAIRVDMGLDGCTMGLWSFFSFTQSFMASCGL